MIRKQLDWVAEASHRVFADTFEIEIALNEVGERAGQQHRFPQLLGEGFETRSHVDRRTDDGEVEPRAAGLSQMARDEQLDRKRPRPGAGGWWTGAARPPRDERGHHAQISNRLK